MIFNPLRYIQQDIWQTAESELSAGQLLAVKSLKILLLAIQGFQKNAGELRATALTMYTVLSIVPVIALLFGIAKGFGFEKMLQRQLLQQIPAQDTMMIRLMEFAEKMLANTAGGVVAGMGVIMLLWTVMKVIGTVEEAFNAIWHIQQGRTLAQKLTDYLSLMLFAPILLIASSSITVFVSTQITWFVTYFALDKTSSSILLYTLNALPIVIMAALFSFVFLFMPNQKVKWQAGVIAGVITGIIYQIVQWLYLTLQIGVSGYNAIYGSFAALPLFFIWLQSGWMIVLFGCEIAFYIQYYSSYQHNQRYQGISFATKKIMAWQITQLIISRFARAEKALSCEQIAAQLDLPETIVAMLLTALQEAAILVEIKSTLDEKPLFQPAYDTSLITVYTIIEALEQQGNNLLTHSKQLESFVKLNDALQEKLKRAAQDYELKEL